MIQTVRKEYRHIAQIKSPATASKNRKKVQNDPNATQAQKEAATNEHFLAETSRIKNAAARARESCISEDEKSTRFFFAKQKARSAAAKIEGAKTDENNPESYLKYNKKNRKAIEKSYITYWQHIFRDRQVSNQAIKKITNLIKNKIGNPLDPLTIPEAIRSLGLPITAEEIKTARDQLSLGKSPGDDGLPVEFYCIHGDKEGSPLDEWISLMHAESVIVGKLPKSLRTILIRLLFKKATEEEKRQKKNWRPISLINVSAKITTKVLDNRTAKIITQIIPDYQNALKGRLISDSIHTIQTIIHTTNNKYKKSKKEKDGGALLFIDFEKAFDSINTKTFLTEILAALGFPQRYIEMVMLSFIDTTAHIIINGYKTDAVELLGGGRQGDPHFPTLFCIAMFALNLLIESDTDMQGIPVSGYHENFKQTAFMDDITTGISTHQDLSRIKASIDTFCLASGAVVNWDKTVALRLGSWQNLDTNNLPPELKVIPQLTWAENTELIRILGILVGNKVRRDASANNALQKMKQYAQSRKGHNTHLIGRITLTNACLLSQATFPLMHSYCPKSVIDKMETLSIAVAKGTTATLTRESGESSMPRERGGPPIARINVPKFAHGLTAKVLYTALTRSKPTLASHLILTEVLRWGKQHGLRTLTHTLNAVHLDISPSNNSATQPFVLNAIDGWQHMRFHIEQPTHIWETVASLNLFENPLIINDQGIPFSTNPKSPFRLAKKVYNLYDLLNLEHADNERTKYSSFCKPTSIKTPLQLHNENNKVPVAQWEIILAAIPAHIKQTLLKGPAPPSEKEVFACSRFNVDTEATQLGVIWQQQRGQNRTFMSSTYDANRLPTQLDGNPFPFVLPQSELLMFKRVNFDHDENQLLGFAFSIPDSSVPTPFPRFNIKSHIDPSLTDFKQICRKYRFPALPPLPALAQWSPRPSQNWDGIMKAIYLSRVTPVIRQLIYLILINKAWIGENRVKCHRNWQHPAHILRTAKYCLPCSWQDIPNSPQHMFFDCSSVKPAWHLARLLHRQMELGAFPMASWDQLPRVFDTDRLKSVKDILSTAIITDLIQSIWKTHIDQFPKAEKYHSGNRELKTVEDFDSIVYNSQGDSADQALCNFGNYLQRTVFHTPLHAESIKLKTNTEMGGNQIDKDPYKLTIRQQVLRPPPTVNHNKLTIKQQQLYTDTWLRSDFITLDENYMLNIEFPRKATDLTDHDKYPP